MHDAVVNLPFLIPMFDNRLPVDPIVPAIAAIGLAIGLLWIRRIIPRGEEPTSFRATAARTSVLPFLAVGILIALGVVIAASLLRLPIRP